MMLAGGLSLQAQIRVPIKLKATEKTNEEIDKKIDEGLNRLFGKKKKKKKKRPGKTGNRIGQPQESGETATLQIQVQNAGSMTAQEVSIVLKCNEAIGVTGMVKTV